MRVVYSPLMSMHIDLESITAIGDAHFIDRMGSGGYYVGFEIHLKLHDKPLSYCRAVNNDEMRWNRSQGHHEVALIDGTWTPNPDQHSQKAVAAVANLQHQIDKLVEIWRDQ